MAEESQGKPPMIPAATILAIATLLGGYLWLRPALKSSRPPETFQHQSEKPGVQDVQARLWQDPYEAANNHATTLNTTNDHRDARHSVKEVASDLASQVKESTNQVAVMLVMETGRPYADDHESRLKTRYAVVASLGVSGYVPFDDEHIGYFEVTNYWDKLIVPFEWFARSPLAHRIGSLGPRYETVLVLWLEDEAFKDSPVRRLGQLISLLHSGQIDRATNLSFEVIGPRSSTTLLNMLGDTNKVTRVAPGLQEGSLEVYSSWASAADAVLIENPLKNTRAAVQAKLWNDNGLHFRQVGCTDDELCESLVGELKLRGVEVTNRQDCVVLLSEWDSHYGRALPITFAAVVERIRRGSLNSLAGLVKSFEGPHLSQWGRLGPNIWQFSYLRGVDGNIPTPKEAQTSAGKSEGREGQQTVYEMERPEGDSQLDYTRRLASKLTELDHQARKDGRELKAIGVIGSDVYDKLLLLQALRPLFPGRVFFTTDVDARLLHPLEWQSTRNLVIASSFGLDLNKAYQGELPRFRDSYQTGLYLACQMALGSVSTNKLSEVAPQLFEVGHDGLYQLGTNGIVDAPNAKVPSLYPERLRWHPRVHVLGGIVVVLLMTLASLVRFSATVHRLALAAVWPLGRFRPNLHKQIECEFGNDRPFAFMFIVWGFVIALILLIGLIWTEQHESMGEPWSMLGGLSIWPTECLRLVAIFLGLYFLAKGKLDTENVYRQLARDFKLDVAETPPPTRPARVSFGAVNAFISDTVGLERWDAPSPEVTVDVAKLFRDYRQRNSLRKRWHRIGQWTLCSLVLYISLVAIGGLYRPPCRGEDSRFVDLVMQWSSLIVSMLVTFFVVDVTGQCTKFINKLQEHPSTWPTAILEEFGTNSGTAHNHMIEWLDIQLIARLTETVGRLIFYPFTLLFLLVIARNPVFNTWDWPWPLVAIFCLMAACALYCARMLRRCAEHARSKAVGTLMEKLLQAREKPDRKRVDQIRVALREIRDIHQGTFAPWSEHPLLRAVLIPVGGTGLLTLVQYLANGH